MNRREKQIQDYGVRMCRGDTSDRSQATQSSSQYLADAVEAGGGSLVGARVKDVALVVDLQTGFLARPLDAVWMGVRVRVRARVRECACGC